VLQIIGACAIILVGCLDLLLFALAFQHRLPTSGPDRPTVLRGAIELLPVFAITLVTGKTMIKFGRIESTAAREASQVQR
jgi:hypothetical protein